MSSLSNITGQELIKFVISIGYKFERQNKGNHRIFVHNNKKILVIPAYKKKILKKGLLCGILKDIGIPKAEFLNSIN